MSMCVLFFILTGIQYWTTDYFINELKQEESVVFVSFAVISITGPVVGVIVGGNIISKLGGYTTKKSLSMTALFTSFCLVTSIPIPFLDSYIVVCVLLWLLLFFGGAILPALTGIMLNTVKPSQKIAANSIAYLMYNLFGYLPGPFLYGAIYDAG